MARIGNIIDIFEIVSVEEEYVIINLYNKKKYLYFFKLNPVVVLQNNDSYNLDILIKYEEFLRRLNLDFQILIKCNKINLDDYITLEKETKNKLKQNLISEYIRIIKNSLNSTQIYNYFYYLIISSENILKDLEKYSSLINNTDIKCEKMISKKEIIKFIQEGVGII